MGGLLGAAAQAQQRLTTAAAAQPSAT